MAILEISVGLCVILSLLIIGSFVKVDTRHALSPLQANTINVSLLKNGVDNITLQDMKDFQSQNSKDIETIFPNMTANDVSVANPEKVVNAENIESGKNEKNERKTKSTAIATTTAYIENSRARLEAGENFTQIDMDNHRRKVILGSYTSAELFGKNPGDSIGKDVQIGEEFFTVCGVLKPFSNSNVIENADSTNNCIIIPYTAGGLIIGTNNINTYSIISKSTHNIDKVQKLTKDFLLGHYKNNSEYSLKSYSDMTKHDTNLPVWMLGLILGLSIFIILIGTIRMTIIFKSKI
ncbi:MAG: ABC transporter permease [Oscillospiraceae bacterium]